MAESQSREGVSAAHLTSPGSTLGTVAYMSPEQVRAKNLDSRTDLFSFGVVMYEMATGALPFSGGSTGVIYEGILNRAPVPALRLNPNLPPKLDDIINRALEKDRDLRYQSALEMRSELMRLKRDTDSGRNPSASSGSVNAVQDPTERLTRIRGEAYLMLHDGNQAAAEFQKLIDHRGVVVNFPLGALARLGLARAYALQGDTVKAKAAYQDFLALWTCKRV